MVALSKCRHTIYNIIKKTNKELKYLILNELDHVYFKMCPLSLSTSITDLFHEMPHYSLGLYNRYSIRDVQ